MRDKIKLTEALENIGLWQSESQVDKQLGEMDTAKVRRKALESQLQFRKKVLKQQYPDKTVFVLKPKGKQCSIEELTEDMKRLIRASMELDNESDHVSWLVGKEVSHVFRLGDEHVTYHGRVLGTVVEYRAWFNICYDGDDELYQYDLLSNYAEGNLVVLGRPAK